MLGCSMMQSAPSTRPVSCAAAKEVLVEGLDFEHFLAKS